MSGQTATRLTCFAIISAIEEDLRGYIRSRGGLVSGAFPPDVHARAKARWEENANARGGAPSSDDELLSYTDFGDLAAILARTKGSYPSNEQLRIPGISNGLQRNAAARNRVCHSRPLEPEDLPTLLDFARELTSIDGMDCDQAAAALKRLAEDPTFVLHLRIPEYWSIDDNVVPHNLPLPEFDDTGFLGRAKDRRELLKLLASPFPVITLVGEGGVGKTALAMRCLYDLVDKENGSAFDCIVWVSSKIRVLTPSGVTQIKDAISDTLGLLETVGKALGVPENVELPSLIAEISDYMAQFRILLAIDNLESLSIAELRPLLLAVSSGSKILVTSRVGLGEMEIRYALDSLDQDTAITLARRFASARNVAFLAGADRAILESYCRGLFNNPLLIKWFVAAIAAGATPNKLLSRAAASYQEAIRFCFENLYERLSEAEREVLHTIASARRPLSHAELVYIIGSGKTGELDWALNTLHQSSMLRRSVESKTTPTIYYALTPIATEFIALRAPPSKNLFSRVQNHLRYVQTLAESEGVKRATYKYDPLAISTKSKDERISAAFLLRAISEMQHSRFDEAIKLVAQAKELLPGYSESYRIGGIIEAKRGDMFKADDEFQHAIELAENPATALYTQAQVLMNDDPARALQLIEQALNAAPADPTLLTSRALALTRTGRYAEAAIIYGELDKDLTARPRRWRLSTRDQHAECYRRWMEVDCRMRDLKSLEEHFLAALHVLDRAFETGDFDEKTVERLGRVMDEIRTYEVRPEVASAIKDFLAHNKPIWTAKSMVLRSRVTSTARIDS